jgi:hypothetical protein
MLVCVFQIARLRPLGIGTCLITMYGSQKVNSTVRSIIWPLEMMWGTLIPPLSFMS